MSNILCLSFPISHHIMATWSTGYRLPPPSFPSKFVLPSVNSSCLLFIHCSGFIGPQPSQTLMVIDIRNRSQSYWFPQCQPFSPVISSQSARLVLHPRPSSWTHTLVPCTETNWRSCHCSSIGQIGNSIKRTRTIRIKQMTKTKE